MSGGLCQLETWFVFQWDRVNFDISDSGPEDVALCLFIMSQTWSFPSYTFWQLALASLDVEGWRWPCCLFFLAFLLCHLGQISALRGKGYDSQLVSILVSQEQLGPVPRSSLLIVAPCW